MARKRAQAHDFIEEFVASGALGRLVSRPCQPVPLGTHHARLSRVVGADDRVRSVTLAAARGQARAGKAATSRRKDLTVRFSPVSQAAGTELFSARTFLLGRRPGNVVEHPALAAD